MKTTPSAMPWKSGTHRQIVDAEGNVICELWSHMGIDEADANEEIIVRAVNAHDDLVAALEILVNGHSINGLALGIAALEKAKS